MKIPAILTCLLAVFLASMPVRNARADEVSFDVFYNNLANDGDWYNTPEYGYVWQPTVSVKNEKWRPYTDGYWAQTDDGWTWVSYENFGWATYHYGRWTRLKDLGWAWVPGYDWGPGWVSWRTSDDVVGWAPLPPKVEQGLAEGAPVPSGGPVASIDYNTVESEDYGPAVDVNYDIGPQNYCFVETRSFGAPVLAQVILPPERNIVIIERTVNVTNIYRGGGPGGGFVVFNRGPDFNFINARCERPIQQLRIERHEDVVFLQNGIRGGGNANVVRNGVFTVAAPPIARGPVNFAQIRPVRVKQTIARTEVVHGWSNSGADPAAVQRLRAQFKQQAQQAPPPRRDNVVLRARANEPAREREPAAAGNALNPASRPGPNAPVNPAQREARENARPNGQPAVPAPAPAEGNRPPRPDVRPNAPAGAPPANEQGLTPEERKAARRAARQQPGGEQAPVNPAPASTPAADAERDARRAQRQQEKAAQPQPPAPAEAKPTPDAERDARRAQRQQEKAAQPQPPAQPETNPSADADRDARRAQRQQEKAAQPQPPAQPANPASDPDREARRAERQQEKATQGERPAQQPGKPAAPNPDRDARRAEREQQQQRAPQPEQPPHHADATPQATAAANGDRR